MEAILQAKEISRTYHTGSVDVPALKQCSLEFGKGEFTAIIGKSGSGKSTLLRILGSMDTPDSGSVLIKGEDITHMKDKKLSGFRRRNIGFIYQDYSLFPEFTSYENIVMPILLDGKKPDDAKVDEILSELEISHCKNKYPSEMSGGEQQRVSIARALITSPAVIFADEPTGNLDAGSAETVAKMLSKASQKYEQTIIMVTHTVQNINLCDKVIFMGSGGKICYCGKPDKMYEYFGKDSLVDVYSELASNVDMWNMKYLMLYKEQHLDKNTEIPEVNENEKMRIE